MKKEGTFDYEQFKEEALKALQSGKPIMGEEGIFTPLLKHFLAASFRLKWTRNCTKKMPPQK